MSWRDDPDLLRCQQKHLAADGNNGADNFMAAYRRLWRQVKQSLRLRK
ncbi:MAG: hypothetical protein KGR98_02180 [Verrucomicrobia bacterium]|nr:hypothetical protein [Verrucomicrobiota bacterium]